MHGGVVAGRMRVLSFNPFVSLAAGFLLQFLAGNSYLFGVYAGDLRSIFGISQSQVQLLGTLLNIGVWTGFTGGTLLDRFGRLPTIISGAALIFLGYFVIFLASSGIAAGPDPRWYPLWCVMFFCAGQGISFFTSVGLKINIQNFTPSQRGQIVGLLMAAFGISGGILSLTYSAFFYGKVANMLLFLSILCSTLGLLFGLVVNVTGGVGSSEIPRFAGAEESVQENFAFRVKLWYGLCLALVVYVLIASLLKPNLPENAIVALAVVGLVMVLCVTLLPIGTGPWVMLRAKPTSVIVDVAEEGPKVDVSDETPLLKDGSTAAQTIQSPMTLKQLFLQPDFYLLFYIYFAGVGPCIATINNMFSIVMSKSFTVAAPSPGLTLMLFPEASLPNRALVTTFVAIFSAMSTFGRLGFGFVSDKFQLRLNRSFWLIVCIGMTLLSQVSMTVTNLLGFYPILIFNGMAYGGFFALVPSIVADLWGEKNFGLFYGIIVFAPALSSLVFSTAVAGSLADRFGQINSVEVIGSDGDLTRQCIGAECYQYFFVTNIACLSLAVLGSLYMFWKSRRVVIIDQTLEKN